ncbi:MAG: glucose-6-phosphate isomerase [Eubacterium sp.]
MSIRFDYSYAGLTPEEMDFKAVQLSLANKQLVEKSGAGHDFLGWYDYPVSYDKKEYARIKAAAEKINNTCDAFIVIGIGGSYLGSKAVITALTSTFYNEVSSDKRGAPKVYFAGENISGKYMKDLIELVKDQDICVNVISKSGTTTEPAIAFRFFKDMIEAKYGKEGAKDRIFATTDKERGALKFLADQEGYETFLIPDDVGGRYSVYTAVGLLPIAVAGIDIDAFMEGGKAAYEEYGVDCLSENTCYQYAMYRSCLYNRGKATEILVDYEPSLRYFSEWWKQLYGESDGKDGKGLFPASVHFSTDLHSVGQIIQDGHKNIFETVLIVDELDADMAVTHEETDLDGLNYLEGRTMQDVNEKAFLGTLLAHVDGDVPNGIIRISKLDAYHIGMLVYFFEKACGLGGYLLGVNPFNQPGVEAYKKNMFALLHKPGFEELTEKLEKRIKD